MGQRTMRLGCHELGHLIEHRGVAHHRAGPRTSQRRRPGIAATMFLRESPDDCRHMPDERLLRGGSGGRLIVHGNIERLHLPCHVSVARSGREDPVTPLESAVLSAALNQVDHLPEPAFPG